MTSVEWDCIKGSVGEALGLELLMGLSALLTYGLGKLAKKAGKELLIKVFKHVLGKTIPFFAILILAKLIWDILACLGIVMGADDVLVWLKKFLIDIGLL